MNNNLSNIKKALKYLNKNECIGIPTETVYGLAANAYSDKATDKIFKLKKRSRKNPLIVHYYNLKDLKNDCKIDNQFLHLYSKFCPGPITFVLELKEKSKISNNVTNSKNTIAVRFPKHKVARKLLKNLNFPLAAPSANISKRISAVCKTDVIEEFGKKIKFVLDGGESKEGLESTIVNLIGNQKILRLGSLDRSKIEKYLVKKKINQKKDIIMPGQGRIHYSPGLPVRLNIKRPKKFEAFLLISKRTKSNKNFFYLSKNKNLKEVAKNLYKTLRKVKKKGFKQISIEKIPNRGIGEAINDRLLRAAKKK
ncbi:L-threonylcarbamoyladenylate synthase [Candidatus Pelagibacter sp.]|nr:L-threonylcarbamoyladenylate synthase [Candidatus Pelagibacter sp.]